MALPVDQLTLDNLATSTFDDRINELTDDFFPTNPLTMRLLQLERAQGGGNGKFIKQRGAGVKIEEPIIYAGIPGDSYDDGTLFDESEHEWATMLRFLWKHVYVPNNLSGIKVAQNSGGNETQFFDLVEAQADQCFNSLLDLYGYKIYGSVKNANGTVSAGSPTARDPDGLYNALDTAALGHSPTYAVYGGIARSGTWGDPGYAANANLVDAGAAPVTFPLLQLGYSQCVFNRSHPDLGLCDRAIWNQIWERSQPSERNAPGPMRDVGFETIKFNGAEIIPDDHAIPGNFYWLTASGWRLWVLEGRDLIRRSSLYGLSAFPLPNQDKTVDQIVLGSDLVCPAPRLQCLITNIQE